MLEVGFFVQLSDVGDHVVVGQVDRARDFPCVLQLLHDGRALGLPVRRQRIQVLRDLDQSGFRVIIGQSADLVARVVDGDRGVDLLRVGFHHLYRLGQVAIQILHESIQLGELYVHILPELGFQLCLNLVAVDLCAFVLPIQKFHDRVRLGRAQPPNHTGVFADLVCDRFFVGHLNLYLVGYLFLRHFLHVIDEFAQL